MPGGYNPFFLIMTNNYKFQMITIARKEQSSDEISLFWDDKE